MGAATGFSNSFTSGEISDDAWDRTDIQPVAKGCEQASNLMIRIAGPLGKRRGFWDLGPVANQALRGRLVPFRRSVDDALMLEFGELAVRVWSANGAPLIDPDTSAQVEFASPFTAFQAQTVLRFKQIGDIIYFRRSDGGTCWTLQRNSNTSWSFSFESFTNGPWLAENTDENNYITFTGTDEQDLNPASTGAGSILKGQTVTMVASDPIFDPAMVGVHVGATLRIRAGDGNPGVRSWAPGKLSVLGEYCLSNGRVYVCTKVADGDDDADKDRVTTPPLVTEGRQNDGIQEWEYRHDGAGIVQITAVADATHATGVVLATLPVIADQATAWWAEGAYSDFRGWPSAWPTLREERMVDGATTQHLDFLDITETAGFGPTSASFKPGLGTGAIVATDAMRRRMGDDGEKILWTHIATYLIAGTAGGEYLIAGSVLDEPLGPDSIVVKQLSAFGSEDVYPARAHKGVIYVTAGGETLRSLVLDTQQNESGEELTVLAAHIGARIFAQLAWVAQPDNTLWCRLGDGGLAAMVFHQEQQVRGWCSQDLGGGWICEDMAVLPGPGNREALWLMVSRPKAGGPLQRRLWQLSIPSDELFMDGGQFYDGAPVTTIEGLDQYEGETVRVVADGAQIPDAVVTGGGITLPVPARVVMTGLPYVARFKSLKLDTGQLGGLINERQRVASCIVSLTTALARVGVDGFDLETVLPRTADDVPAPAARRTIKRVTMRGDSLEDPRIVIEDDTAYDFILYSLKPHVTAR